MTRIDDEFHRDLRFDEFLMLGPEEAEAVVDLLTPVLDATRQRGRKIGEREAFNRTVGLVVANALVGGEQGVHYSRRLATYSGISPYKPPWLGSKRLRGVVDGLAEEGLVGGLDGSWAGVFKDGKGLESSFWAAPPLAKELEALGIDLGTVLRDSETAPVIKLKDENHRLIRYDPGDEEVVRRSGELRAYNAFIDGQDISIPGVETPKFSGLARTYNAGSLKLGGRHFGGWWQRKSKVERSKILINGEATEELDFGGFNPRVLYHLTGQEFRGDDPYDIPKIKRLLEERGIDWETKGRNAVKRMLNIAISAKSRAAFSSPKSIKEIDLPEELIKRCVPIIIEHHNPIKDHILKGISLELMNLESDICNNIIVSAFNNGVTVLPIFDSFITSKNNREYLLDKMISNYRSLFKCDPSIH